MAISDHKVVVDAKAPAIGSAVRTLLNYRELLTTLAFRDYRVRFVQTRLGYIWAVLQPLVLVFILTVVFSNMLNVDTAGVPYPLFALSAQILWTYFSFSAIQGGQSLVQSQHMIRKIWFPRVVLPFSKSLVGLIDLAIGLVLLIVMTFIYDLTVEDFYLIPLALLLTWIAGLGISLWTSALSIKFRDVQHALPYFIQFLFFLTPVAYPTGILSKSLPGSWAWLPYLNPVAAPIDIMREGLFESQMDLSLLSLSIGISIFLFLSGWVYFHRIERNMADTL